MDALEIDLCEPQPEQVFELADTYAQAARPGLNFQRKMAPLSRAPARLLAIHAIELYLNATLLRFGLSHLEIRQMQHDLQRRAEIVGARVNFRKRTYEHLIALSTKREYIVSRYDPNALKLMSQLNRLTATLDEVEQKCRLVVAAATPPKPIAQERTPA